jgi:hypothetical protein
MRLEVLPPIGGPRLVVITDGRKLIALDPAHRRIETWDSESQGIERLLGIELGTADVHKLLAGVAPCPKQETGVPVPKCAFRPGDPTRTILDSMSYDDPAGRTLLLVEYPDPWEEGEEWARSIRLRRPGEDNSLLLKRTSGPTSARLDPSLFSTEWPAHFEKGVVLGEKGLTMAVEGEEGAP